MWPTLRRSLADGLRARARPAAPRVAWMSTKSDAELAMESSLSAQLEATHVKVLDVSGGCGAMYDVEVVSPQFVGLTRVKQHRMVNEALKQEIKDMHGLTIRTMTPEQFANKH
ncbi:hypothetical protein P43SY_006395 [Pythium insidiosum]|uniref:BolA-like protein n=1 Tax=Pythium insidiosum TaxID=114742 RepID=A0AAD5Q5S5_PYTIN|nr:hypothetical protein P43SY_006395 [Pythium insidiosum]